MTFTDLLREIKSTYSTETNTFHVLATRYYLGSETRESLLRVLTSNEIEEIIKNR